MRVMQVKYNQKVKMNQFNSRPGQVFALNFSNTGLITGTCCGFGKDPQIPSHQQGYGIYNRRAMLGLGGQGGLASRVVNHQTDTSLQGYTGTEIVANTVKRTPDFTPAEHISNKRSDALRCALNANKCPAVDPICHNECAPLNPRSSIQHKKLDKFTQDLGYLSCSQQLDKKLSLRTGSTSTPFESNLMNNGYC